MLAGAAWWVTAAFVLSGGAPLTRPQVLTLGIVGAVQLLTVLACAWRCLAAGWALTLTLGLLLLVANALFFFTPALGVPVLLVTDAMVAGSILAGRIAKPSSGP